MLIFNFIEKCAV